VYAVSSTCGTNNNYDTNSLDCALSSAAVSVAVTAVAVAVEEAGSTLHLVAVSTVKNTHLETMTCTDTNTTINRAAAVQHTADTYNGVRVVTH
jgi:hypothetical protein